MIVRRMVAAARRQDWFVIAIELMIVALGIVIGLEVDDWNQARTDREREAAYLDRLEADFVVIETRMKQSLTTWGNTIRSVEAILDDIGGYRKTGAWPRPDDELVRDLDGALGGRIPAPRSATFMEMLSAGDLRLLRDAGIRDALLSYDTQAQYGLEGWRLLATRASDALAAFYGSMEFDADENPISVYDEDTDDIVLVHYDRLAQEDTRTALKQLMMTADNQLGLATAQYRISQQVLALLKERNGPRSDQE